MDTKQIETIVVIADEGSLSKASERLYISQPALSQQLRKIEEEMGIALFTRTKRKMIPTSAGEVYISNARKILKIKAQTYDQIRAISSGERGQIVVGVAPGRCATMVTKIFPIFHEKYPNHSIKCVNQDFRRNEDSLLKGELDFGFVAFDDTQYPIDTPLSYRDFGQEEVHIAVSRGHPLAKEFQAKPGDLIIGQGLSLFECEGFAFTPESTKFRCFVNTIMQEAGFQPMFQYDALEIQTAYDLMARGTCCTFVPAAYIPHSKWEVHFQLTPPRFWSFALCWNSKRTLNEAEQYFVDLCAFYYNDYIVKDSEHLAEE